MTLQLPNVTFPTTAGEVNLTQITATYLILYFYPKDNTPGCTLESQDFNHHYDRLTQLDALIYGVSRDSIQSHTQFKNKCALRFELISDANQILCQHFKVLKLKKNYGKTYTGIERSSFLFAQGKCIQEWRNVKVDGHVAQVIQAIEDH